MPAPTMMMFLGTAARGMMRRAGERDWKKLDSVGGVLRDGDGVALISKREYTPRLSLVSCWRVIRCSSLADKSSDQVRKWRPVEVGCRRKLASPASAGSLQPHPGARKRRATTFCGASLPVHPALRYQTGSYADQSTRVLLETGMQYQRHILLSQRIYPEARAAVNTSKLLIGAKFVKILDYASPIMSIPVGDAEKHAIEKIENVDEGENPHDRTDPVEAKKVLRKIDYRLLPVLMALYTTTFLDRVNIGNARLWNMERDLGMKGYQYNIAVLGE